MFKKLTTLNTIHDSGAVLIVRLPELDSAERVCHAAIEGGFRALEIPLTVPGAIGLINRLSEQYRADGVVVGAGTVLDGYAAYDAISHGASFLVSPQLNPEMIRVANRYQIPTISGAFTPTEVVNSVQAGADIIKIFPTENNGIPFAKALLAPLDQVAVLPAGGVTADNVKDWFDLGVLSVGVGSAVTKAWQRDGDFTRVTDAARTFMAAVEAVER
ncbi:bifunctional 4-hydroxy-2-oxoglutarate aldolase/2-dehydro-3-deoxy-phosphogluconate aldolase [Actinomyces qiguomingii]|uniref:bifunctional 4-hydroxy-2-oxoglutarate aldolase/2-dehydro-3-deoxy-phosphogluconate aldolase n=1 Tax=Actinomyces qiguomingii TaxID=2057800 RepID=UPI000CA04C47|nr:hypothetical protein [Actinomyces qiguomingii]